MGVQSSSTLPRLGKAPLSDFYSKKVSRVSMPEYSNVISYFVTIRLHVERIIYSRTD